MKRCPSGARFDEISKSCVPKRKGFYRRGYFDGQYGAVVGLQSKDSRKELKKRFDEDTVGEYIGELREGQVQFAGDISYDVGHGVTEKQYETWEEGFTAGFMDAVQMEFEHGVQQRID